MAAGEGDGRAFDAALSLAAGSQVGQAKSLTYTRPVCSAGLTHILQSASHSRRLRGVRVLVERPDGSFHGNVHQLILTNNP